LSHTAGVPVYVAFRAHVPSTVRFRRDHANPTTSGGTISWNARLPSGAYQSNRTGESPLEEPLKITTAVISARDPFT